MWEGRLPSHLLPVESPLSGQTARADSELIGWPSIIPLGRSVEETWV